jgi:hypothetical protein
MISDHKNHSEESVDLSSEKWRFQVPFLLMLILVIFSVLPAENPETSSKPEISSYYYLKNHQLQNFSCFISTDKFRQFQEEQGDTIQTSPLKVVRTRNGKLYYVLQPFDGQDGAMNQEKFMEEVLQVRQQFQEFYDDWEYFLISSPLSNVPDSVKRSQSGDTLTVKYRPESSNKDDEITLKITINGLLMMRQERLPQQKRITRPVYQSREEGQVCVGWDSELFKKDSLIEKSTVQLTLSQNMPFPVPLQADIKAVFPEDSSTRETALYFHHYEFNFPLQELALPDSLR